MSSADEEFEFHDALDGSPESVTASGELSEVEEDDKAAETEVGGAVAAKEDGGAVAAKEDGGTVDESERSQPTTVEEDEFRKGVTLPIGSLEEAIDETIDKALFNEKTAGEAAGEATHNKEATEEAVEEAPSVPSATQEQAQKQNQEQAQEKAQEQLQEEAQEQVSSPVESLEEAIGETIEEVIFNEEPQHQEEDAETMRRVEEAIEETIEEALLNEGNGMEVVDEGADARSASIVSQEEKRTDAKSASTASREGGETSFEERRAQFLSKLGGGGSAAGQAEAEEPRFVTERAKFITKYSEECVEEELKEEGFTDKRSEFMTRYNEETPSATTEKDSGKAPQPFEERRADFLLKYEQTEEEEQQQQSSYLGSWGGMFSALSGIGSSVKAKASSGLDKLYDVLDPNVPDESSEAGEQPVVPEEDPKSIKSLLDRLSPKGGESSWLSGLDKTFDLASDTLGHALMGGIKKIETSVGVTIEPVSSSPNPSGSNDNVGSGRTNDKLGSGSTNDKLDSGSTDDKLDGGSTDEPPNDDGADKEPSQVSKLGKNIYAAGLNTLERLGRTTAGIVESTRGRLTPLIESSTRASPTMIDRAELKKSFLTLFDEYSGNEALEKIQLGATEASIAYKTKVKALNPQKLKQVQASMKGVGAMLDGVDGSVPLDWSRFGDGFGQGELAPRLQQSISDSVAKLGAAADGIEELRSRVDAPIPPDNATLVVYFGRLHLAKMTAAALYVYKLLDFDRLGEKDVVLLASMFLHSANAVAAVAEDDLLNDARREAVKAMLQADVAKAGEILKDSTLALQPSVKLARFAQIEM